MCRFLPLRKIKYLTGFQQAGANTLSFGPKVLCTWDTYQLRKPCLLWTSISHQNIRWHLCILFPSPPYGSFSFEYSLYWVQNSWSLWLQPRPGTFQHISNSDQSHIFTFSAHHHSGSENWVHPKGFFFVCSVGSWVSFLSWIFDTEEVASDVLRTPRLFWNHIKLWVLKGSRIHYPKIWL